LLFNKRLLQTNLNNFEFPQGYDFERTQKIIGNWQKAIKDGNYDKTKETQVQSSFLNLFFNVVLGYAEMHDNSDEWHLVNEAKTEFDGTKADGALGYFTKDDKTNITRAVIELKDAKTPLDKKQSSRKDYDSPVSQAFSYSSKFDRCDWIIVSNFKEIRLYNKDRGQGYYESFEILSLNDEKEFKRFYFLLCKENLIDRNRNSVLDTLVKDTSKNEEDISKQFYKDFKSLRQELFVHICEHNPDINKKCLLEKTQKLLDRLIFIMFCEDSSTNLLPYNTLKKYYDMGNDSPVPSDNNITPLIMGLFKSIDKGNSTVKPPINAYNGGLFAVDEILDNLIIKDTAWENVIKLAKYDFESDLNVNILGHIFEQSLSDLEQIKAEIDGVEQDKTKSKRKKDGIFYTPEYITRYIVEQTVGKYLEENPDKLETIKILDPACGSGAFINQAHTFLKEQHQIRTEEKIDNERASKRGGQEFVALNMFKHINVAETDRSILLNNLYGVDLNEESTEITKLALWLKTAKKDQPLQNLDNNIKCGNSLIDDPEIACDKAFNWDDEFKEIMDNGGFDVVIGNPPYVRQELFSNDKQYLEKNYEVYTGVSDLFVYFFEKGLKILKEGGYFAFIVSNKFLKAGYGKKLTQYLQKNYTILEIIDFGDLQIFEGATTYPCIITIKKTKPSETQIATCLKLKNLDNVTNLKTEAIEKGFDLNISKTDETWLLNNTNELNLLEKVTTNSVRLEDFVNKNIFVGLKTGFNEAFVINENLKNDLCTKDLKNCNLIKPYIKGTDISRYYTEPPSLWLINTHNGYKDVKSIDVKNAYPTIYEYLNNYREQLEKRTDKGYHYTNLRSCAYLDEFDKPKIIYSEIATKGQFYLDELGYYPDMTTFVIGSDSKYLLTLLNSKLMTYLFKQISSEIRGGFLRWKKQYIKDLPICIASKEQQTSLASKAEQMIELNKQLHEGVKSALGLLQAEYQPKKISQKLAKFYTLGLHPFLEELEKQGVKLSLSQKEELLTWYKQKSETLTNIKNQIDTLDRSIDQDVYKLYNLTEDEIKIIEGA